jgi:hypothetical protein
MTTSVKKYLYNITDIKYILGEFIILQKIRGYGMYKEKLTSNKIAVSEIIGVILLIAISIAVAAVLHASMGGTTSQVASGNPFVSMMQTGGHITILSVENGEISKDEASAIIQDDSGSSTGLVAELHVDEDHLTGGDRILISETIPGSLVDGERYTVYLISGTAIVGQTEYVYEA